MASSLLPRVLEPEVMDAPDEARDYDSMDHAEVNRRFVADFLATWRPEGLKRTPPAGAGTEILDLGCGTARISIELCQACPEVHVLGIDMAGSMLDLGRRHIETAGLGQRITLQRADAKALPFHNGRFQAVISNSIVHHVHKPQLALAEAVRVTASGGFLFVRDLMRPTDDATVFELVETYAAGANSHQRALFDASLRAALSLDEIRVLVAALDFAPSTVTATSDRHWTWTTINH